MVIATGAAGVQAAVAAGRGGSNGNSSNNHSRARQQSQPLSQQQQRAVVDGGLSITCDANILTTAWRARSANSQYAKLRRLFVSLHVDMFTIITKTTASSTEINNHHHNPLKKEAVRLLLPPPPLGHSVELLCSFFLDPLPVALAQKGTAPAVWGHTLSELLEWRSQVCELTHAWVNQRQREDESKGSAAEIAAVALGWQAAQHYAEFRLWRKRHNSNNNSSSSNNSSNSSGGEKEEEEEEREGEKQDARRFSWLPSFHTTPGTRGWMLDLSGWIAELAAVVLRKQAGPYSAGSDNELAFICLSTPCKPVHAIHKSARQLFIAVAHKATKSPACTSELHTAIVTACATSQALCCVMASVLLLFLTATGGDDGDSGACWAESPAPPPARPCPDQRVRRLAVAYTMDVSHPAPRMCAESPQQQRAWCLFLAWIATPCMSSVLCTALREFVFVQMHGLTGHFHDWRAATRRVANKVRAALTVDLFALGDRPLEKWPFLPGNSRLHSARGGGTPSSATLDVRLREICKTENNSSGGESRDGGGGGDAPPSKIEAFPTIRTKKKMSKAPSCLQYRRAKSKFLMSEWMCCMCDFMLKILHSQMAATTTTPPPTPQEQQQHDSIAWLCQNSEMGVYVTRILHVVQAALLTASASDSPLNALEQAELAFSVVMDTVCHDPGPAAVCCKRLAALHSTCVSNTLMQHECQDGSGAYNGELVLLSTLYMFLAKDMRCHADVLPSNLLAEQVCAAGRRWRGVAKDNNNGNKGSAGAGAGGTGSSNASSSSSMVIVPEHVRNLALHSQSDTQLLQAGVVPINVFDITMCDNCCRVKDFVTAFKKADVRKRLKLTLCFNHDHGDDHDNDALTGLSHRRSLVCVPTSVQTMCRRRGVQRSVSLCVHSGKSVVAVAAEEDDDDGDDDDDDNGGGGGGGGEAFPPPPSSVTGGKKRKRTTNTSSGNVAPPRRTVSQPRQQKVSFHSLRSQLHERVCRHARLRKMQGFGRVYSAPNIGTFMCCVSCMQPFEVQTVSRCFTFAMCPTCNSNSSKTTTNKTKKPAAAAAAPGKGGGDGNANNNNNGCACRLCGRMMAEHEARGTVAVQSLDGTRGTVRVCPYCTGRVHRHVAKAQTPVPYLAALLRSAATVAGAGVLRRV